MASDVGESHWGWMEEFNLQESLYFRSFSLVWLVPRALEAMDLSIIWPAKGPSFCGSDP